MLLAIVSASMASSTFGFSNQTSSPHVNTSNTTAVAENPRLLTEIIQNLSNYRAPILIWDKIVLKSGEVVSPVLKQIPVKLANGQLEENKAVVVSRGNYVNTSKGSEFTRDPEGKWFQIELIKNGVTEGVSTGQLQPNGWGSADWCGPPNSVVGAANLEDAKLEVMNCYFKTTLEKDGGVRVIWTMLHRGEHGM
jgi:hypothetical protein